MPNNEKPIVAIATGDPAGIGPEISMKTALDAGVRALCRPILVGDPGVMARHAQACGIGADMQVVERISDVAELRQRLGLTLLSCPPVESSENFAFSEASAASGRASIGRGPAQRSRLRCRAKPTRSSPRRRTRPRLPWPESISTAIHPSLRVKPGSARDDVYLMLCFGDVKIVHCTLHVSVQGSTGADYARARCCTRLKSPTRTIKRLGTANPRICVGGLNPHAGEGGLFGQGRNRHHQAGDRRREKEPASTSAGPFGADTMFHPVRTATPLS